MYKIILAFLLLQNIVYGQNYTSYFTGNPIDLSTNPSGGVCLMGGAVEDENAMKWFLQRANGGDVLVLRTSGGDGYNNYLYSQSGIAVNSVETIVCNNPAASKDPYLLQKIQQAEAIWFAGGDQWTYITYWRNTAVDSLINIGLKQRKIVIGGISAGLAIQGRFYYTAKNGSATSAIALSNPYDNLVTVDSSKFIQNSYLDDVITDTHFDNPNRKGRLITFLARINADFGIFGKAIACDEYTSVCIDTNGIAKVFGGYPIYDDNAYFIQTNCELPSQTPEICSDGTPLTWNLNGQAIKVYQIKGTSDGKNNFNLNDWKNGTGGIWQDWSVEKGKLSEQLGNPLNCVPLTVNNTNQTNQFNIFPNPASDKVFISSNEQSSANLLINIFDQMGKNILIHTCKLLDYQTEVDVSYLKSGLYFMSIITNERVYTCQIILNK